MKMTAQEYARRVRRTGPHSPLLADIAWAFCVGGGICLLGEVLRQRFLAAGIETELAGTLTSCSLIALSAVLTRLVPEAGRPGRGRVAGAHHRLCQCGGQCGHRVQSGRAGAGHRSQDVHHRRAGHRIRHAGGGGVRRGAVAERAAPCIIRCSRAADCTAALYSIAQPGGFFAGKEKFCS